VSDQVVPIRDASIRLGQLLKLVGLADDGAVAKAMLDDGLVLVDGEPETRRGRQIRPGDVVTVDVDGEVTTLAVQSR
jgi:ribosome-associated protein